MESTGLKTHFHIPLLSSASGWLDLALEIQSNLPTNQERNKQNTSTEPDPQARREQSRTRASWQPGAGGSAAAPAGFGALLLPAAGGGARCPAQRWGRAAAASAQRGSRSCGEEQLC